MLALLNGKRYRICEIKRENWQPIATNEGGAIASFVDGGSAGLLKTPAAELQRVRTATITVAGNKIVAAKQREGYALIKTDAIENSSGKISYSAAFIDSNLDIAKEGNKIAFGKSELLEGDSMETALTRAGGAVRRLAELAAARKAAEELSNMKEEVKRFAVLDGTLETFSERESRAMDDLAAAAKAAGVILGSVAKTCALLTDTGEPLIAAAERLAEGKEGYITVAEGMSERHKATVAVARLNSSASHLFRIEAANGSELLELATALAMQSNDIAFPGYPYGLIMADRFARISDNDAEITRSKMAATANAEIKALLKDEKALNAHSILDGKIYNGYYKWL